MDEQKVFDDTIELISPLGQFHYKGIDLSIAEGGTTYIPGKFHSGEDGDSTYHTGILGQALAWRYVNNPNKQKETVDAIDKLLSYFELFIKNVGHIGRNIVSEEAYNQFLPIHKNGTKEYSLTKLDKPGGHMRYKEVILNRKKYYFRYDVSADQMTGAINFLYWVNKLMPGTEYAQRAVAIAQSQFDYYEKNNWKIFDDKGNLTRFGIHAESPSLTFPINKLFGSTLRIIIGQKPKFSKWDLFVFNFIMRTYIPGLYKTKRTRDQFNNYMFVMNLHPLINEGVKLEKCIKRMFSETRGEINLYNNIVENILFKTKNLTARDAIIEPKKYHSFAFTEMDFVVAFNERSGYNLWENSAYRKVVAKRPSEHYVGSEGLLQSYWIGK